MRVLLLGAGGREHALAWKLAQSSSLEKLWVAPGNPGTARWGLNLSLNAEDPAQVLNAARAHQIDLVVVGPEAPLVAGVSDLLRAQGVPVFGPSSAAARLEGSKAFAKEVMLAAGVPTARAEVFDDVETAAAYARAQGPLVVKADGLAAGKGVVVASDGGEAERAVRALGALGASGRRLVLEERLEGEEVSLIALCDGTRHVLLPLAQDHKRVGDGDRGPNTGGMGAYAPAPFLDDPATEAAAEATIAPVLRELARRGTPLRGALYAGLMLTAAGPQVLEYNVRLGDPEAQVLLMQLEEDLLPLLHACAVGALPERRLRTRPGVSVGVVLAAEGYPASPRLGDAIDGLEEGFDETVQVFQAGTRVESGRVVTAGGRVLTVCARGATVAEARARAYAAVDKVRFAGAHWRRDIGDKALR